MSPRNLFRRFVLVVLITLAAALTHRDAAAADEPLKTQNVIIVTLDGVRVQEFFGGADSVIVDAKRELSGIQDVGDLRTKYMRDSPEERRAVLMPFMWGRIAKDGVIFGNPALKSSAQVTNHFKVSYPGYAEMLTGHEQPKVASNLPFRLPATNVFEYIKKELAWSYTDIAVFGSWQTFNLIAHREPDAFFTNAGYAKVPSEYATPGMEPLNSVQMDLLTPWDTARFDRVTCTLALEYLRKFKPRILYVALDESDDWGHDRRYDRVIHAIHLGDDAIRQLWEAAQQMEEYRGKTTLIVTTDHGRGITTQNWTDHDKNTPGSENVWIAMMGPDTPARGDVENVTGITSGQIAPTIAHFFGLDYSSFEPRSAAPLPGVFGP